MNIPDGWKLVPIEPTPEMIRAGSYTYIESHARATIYKAMVGAAPPPPTPQSGAAIK